MPVLTLTAALLLTASDGTPPPMPGAPRMTAARLLAASDVTPPPMREPPKSDSATRQARLLDKPAALKDSEPSQMAGRMLMAPVLGALGGGIGVALGVGAGVIAFLADGARPVSLCLSPAGWCSSSSGSLGAAVIVGLSVGGLLGFVGLALGVAIGASLFGDHFRDLFSRSLPWAFLMVGIAAAISVVTFFVAPALAPVLFGITGTVAAGAVPFIVEARRVAVPAERAPEATVSVATF